MSEDIEVSIAPASTSMLYICERSSTIKILIVCRVPKHYDSHIGNLDSSLAIPHSEPPKHPPKKLLLRLHPKPRTQTLPPKTSKPTPPLQPTPSRPKSVNGLHQSQKLTLPTVSAKSSSKNAPAKPIIRFHKLKKRGWKYPRRKMVRILVWVQDIGTIVSHSVSSVPRIIPPNFPRFQHKLTLYLFNPRPRSYPDLQHLGTSNFPPHVPPHRPYALLPCRPRPLLASTPPRPLLLRRRGPHAYRA